MKSSSHVKFCNFPRQLESARFSRYRVSGAVNRFSMQRKSHMVSTHVP